MKISEMGFCPEGCACSYTLDFFFFFCCLLSDNLSLHMECEQRSTHECFQYIRLFPKIPLSDYWYLTYETEFNWLIIMLLHSLHFSRILSTFSFVLADATVFLNSEEKFGGPDDFETIGDPDLSPFIEQNDQEIENLNGFDNFDISSTFDPSPFADGHYREIVPVSDHLDSFINDNLFAIDPSTSCLEDDKAAHLNTINRRDSFCPSPETSINVPQFPNILHSVEEPETLPPTIWDTDKVNDLAPTRSADYFCASDKYRVDIRIGRMLVPVCGPGNMVYALPPQQGWPGYGVQGYYPNVEFSTASTCNVIGPRKSFRFCHVYGLIKRCVLIVSLLAPLCPVENVFCCQSWRPYSIQRIEWNSPVDLGVGITCFHLIELGWTGYNEIDDSSSL